MSMLSTNSAQSQWRCGLSAMTQLHESGSMNMVTSTSETPMNSSILPSTTLEAVGMWAPAKPELEGQEGGVVRGMETLMQARREGSMSQSVDNSMRKEGACMTPADSSIAAGSGMGLTHDRSAVTIIKG